MNNDAQHVQGEWVVRAAKWEGELLVTVVSDEHEVGICELNTCDLTEDEVMANARLIKAAPKLLKALQHYLPTINQHHGQPNHATLAIDEANGLI